MKRFFSIVLALLIFCSPAGAREISGDEIKPGVKLTAETVAYMALPGVSMTGAQIATVDANIRAIKYGSGVTLSSLTAKFSTVAGTQFVTQISQDLRWLSSTVWGSTALTLTWNDGTNTWAMTNGAAGTGETYGGNLVTNGTFNTDANWGTHTNWTIATNVATAAVSNSNLQQQLVTTSGWLLKNDFDWTHTGGILSADIETTPASTFTTSGAKTFYRTVGLNKFIRFYGGAVSGVLDNVVSRQIPTPDTTGLVGSAGSGALFNPNAATFSVTVVKQ